MHAGKARHNSGSLCSVNTKFHFFSSTVPNLLIAGTNLFTTLHSHASTVLRAPVGTIYSLYLLYVGIIQASSTVFRPW
jgi:hypothetical protein